MTLQIDVKISGTKAAEERCDALVLFVPEKDHFQFEVTREIDKKLKKALASVLKDEQFQGKGGDVLVYHGTQALKARRVILAGVGKSGALTGEQFRRASGAAAIAARNAACARVSFAVPDETTIGEGSLVYAITEGALLGSYRYTKFKTKEEEIEPGKRIEKISLITRKTSEIQEAISRAVLYADATYLARDLTNEPANALNPAVLADIARQIAQDAGLEIKILEKADLEKMGAGAILGVGSGSGVPPRLIQLSYNCEDKSAKKVALVGKGITFDSGGLSLKPSKFMETMKSDMAGAAAVLSAMRALPQIKPNCNVIGILCAAENMPSGSAIRPGDVLRAMNGKSIEVINTDAEGRLVLSDGLSWAAKQEADVMIDLATLTGACIIGLGPYVAGAMGNDKDLIQEILEAGRYVGEPYWELPIPDDYDFMIKSDIADMKNLAQNSEAGAIQGALFLREFIGKAKWVHLDIAGPTWYEKEFYHMPKNGTGFGARTLLQLLSSGKI